jgi:hypothetical protein
MSTISSGSSGLTWTSDNSSNLAITLTSIVDNTGNTVPSTTLVKGASKAWVNFNGTTSPGTIRGSFNVASVTRTATGVYVVNFTTPMSDANYAVSTIGNNTSSNILFASLNGVPTTANCPVQAYSTTVNVNVDYFMFVVNGS